MTRSAILVCRDPRDRQWQLGPLPPATGRLTLVGWRQEPERQDAGVPEPVARVLSRALTSVARVTFPSSFTPPIVTGAWSPVGDDLVRALTGQGIAGRLIAKLKGTPPNITLTSTRSAETAMRLFDDAGFPWWMQGQVVLLSESEAAPPDVDVAALLALFEDDWTKQAAALRPVGVKGAMRPGVDGDVAGVLSLTDAFDQAVLAALERETRLAGFDWAVVPESAFRP